MSNHIHLIWQIQKGYEREGHTKKFFEIYIAEAFRRDLKKNHFLMS